MYRLYIHYTCHFVLNSTSVCVCVCALLDDLLSFLLCRTAVNIGIGHWWKCNIQHTASFCLQDPHLAHFLTFYHKLFLIIFNINPNLQIMSIMPISIMSNKQDILKTTTSPLDNVLNHFKWVCFPVQNGRSNPPFHPWPQWPCSPWGADNHW